jgi:hypothetical protein
MVEALLDDRAGSADPFRMVFPAFDLVLGDVERENEYVGVLPFAGRMVLPVRPWVGLLFASLLVECVHNSSRCYTLCTPAMVFQPGFVFPVRDVRKTRQPVAIWLVGRVLDGHLCLSGCGNVSFVLQYRVAEFMATVLSLVKGGSMSQKLRHVSIILASAIFAAVAACTPLQVATHLQSQGIQASASEIQAISDHLSKPVAVLASTPSSSSIEDMIVQRWAGTGQENTALRVSRCENHAHNPTLKNPSKKSSAYGLFQFLNGTWKSTGIQKTSDPRLQIEAAFRLWQQRKWQPWKASRGCWSRA